LDGLFDHLNEKEFSCSNFCSDANDVNYDDLIEHYKEKLCDGTYGFSTTRISEIQERIEKLKTEETYFEPENDKIKLKSDWGTFNAK
jgi:hypothetical protein